MFEMQNLILMLFVESCNSIQPRYDLEAGMSYCLPLPPVAFPALCWPSPGFRLRARCLPSSTALCASRRTLLPRFRLRIRCLPVPPVRQVEQRDGEEDVEASVVAVICV